MPKYGMKETIRILRSHMQTLQARTSAGFRKNLAERVDMDDVTACDSLNYLCKCLGRISGKKAIVLLDEYDTPMQESYVYGYWEELTSFMRNLFNATFKTNSSLERALMTGITRVSKESMFSDLNNLNVVSTTSDQYTEAFGFTEQEVFGALEKYQLSDKLEATMQAALSQIEEKNYDSELLGRGFEKEQIRHYGFAFKGKEVLIG